MFGLGTSQTERTVRYEGSPLTNAFVREESIEITNALPRPGPFSCKMKKKKKPNSTTKEEAQILFTFSVTNKKTSFCYTTKKMSSTLEAEKCQGEFQKVPFEFDQTIL